MLSNKSNKELVEAGHQFAKALDADMPLTEIAKLVSALSTRLECSIIRGNELQQKLDALAAENAAKDSAINEVLRKRPGGVYFNKCEEMLLNAMNAPLTEAYLNSARAEGAIAVRNALVLADDGSDIYAIATDTAEQLSSGTHDTADKAG
ncbi:hypothetical protein [Pantoea sp. SJZ147]|uniref:hypothetical protein n=1 Tax=Pantoea sp. SJZ147 TaxID=2572896 RepID=UPI00119F5E73|nr:hypothetical protein [Pantoea sp. SJZ147]TWD32308.1 hypothetical protein FBY13_11931 [Pantoea sp. SJZ147]